MKRFKLYESEWESVDIDTNLSPSNYFVFSKIANELVRQTLFPSQLQVAPFEFMIRNDSKGKLLHFTFAITSIIRFRGSYACTALSAFIPGQIWEGTDTPYSKETTLCSALKSTENLAKGQQVCRSMKRQFSHHITLSNEKSQAKSSA